MISICVGVLLLAAATVALVSRYTPIPNHLSLYAVVAFPFLMVAAPVAAVVLSTGRHWLLTGVAVCLTAVLIAVQVPWFIRSQPNPASVAIRVMTVNMRYGKADPTSLVAVADHNADVVMIQELNPEAVRALSIAGLDAAFPHRVLDDRPGAAGVGFYSRFPLTASNRIGGYQLALVSAAVRIPQVSKAVSALSVHLEAPWPRQIDGWRTDIAKFPSILADLAATDGKGAVIVGGDFNSTIDMRPFRKLLTNGYRDAAEQAGTGRDLTYPANQKLPPFLGIDHVLTRNATAVSTSTVEIPATDHRALLATVWVPKG